MSRLSIVLPGCCGPLPSLDGMGVAVQTLPLWTRLSRARRFNARSALAQQLMSLCGLDDCLLEGAFPYAAVTLLGANHTSIERLRDTGWLRADPVCLHADIDHAILFDQQSLQLTLNEAQELIAELNAHFVQDGLQLFCTEAAHWYLATPLQLNLLTAPVFDVVGRNVHSYMPVGDDATVWKRFMNEAQMLLHASAVNERRSTRGQLPVNSIWLWGEGALPAHTGAAIDHNAVDLLLADDALGKGIARLCETPCESARHSVYAIVDLALAHRHLTLVRDDLLGAYYCGDDAIWQQQLVRLHDEFLSPLIEYALRAKLEVSLYPCHGKAYRLSHHDDWRFWRRGKLVQHVSA